MIKDYYNNLNEREKWTVIGGGICLVIFIYYALIYSPLNSAVSQKSAQLIEQTETLEWMNKVRQQGVSTQKKQKVSNSQLLTLIATQLKEGKTLSSPFKLEQTSSGEVQLSFEAVPFNLFVTWFSNINRNYAFTIKQFDIEKTKVAGVTKLMIIIGAAD